MRLALRGRGKSGEIAERLAQEATIQRVRFNGIVYRGSLRRLHPDNLIAAIDIDHLAGDGRSSVAG